MNIKVVLFENKYLMIFDGKYDRSSIIHWSKLWRRYHNFNNQIVNYYDL